MTEVALVIFSEASKKQAGKTYGLFIGFAQKMVLKVKEFLFYRGFFRTGLGTRLYFYCKREEMELPDSMVEVSDEFKFHIVRLPFSQNRLAGFNNRYLEKLINKKVMGKNISLCYIPSFIKDNGFLSVYDKCPCCDKVLLKMLIDTVLKNLYSEKTDRIGDMDIVVSAGENLTEALAAVRILEPQLRYVSLAAVEKEKAENEVESIFGDSGLSISVVSECKAVLKNADLIINFADASFFSGKTKMNAEAIVFNLAEADVSKAFPDNLIINGLVPDLPKQIVGRLEKDILKCYNRNELAELAIITVNGLTPFTVLDYEISRRITMELEKQKFRISGFKGRHGVLKLDNLKKLANCSS